MKLPFADKVADVLRRTAAGAATSVGRVAAAALRATREPPPAPLPPPPPPAPAPDPARRHTAAKPQALSLRGWWEVVCKVFDEIYQDRLMLIAAGVAFYVMLSLFPALTVLIWLYGLVADPAQIVSLLKDVAFLLPAGALDLIQQQARAIAATTPSSMSAIIVASVLVTVWSANAGMKSMFDAMNIIYNEDEKRSILVYNLHSVLFTLGAVAVFLATLAVLVLAPIVLSYVNLQGTFTRLFFYLRWPILYGMTVVFLVFLNRYGPSRPPERARWSIWGSALGAALWIAVSLAFSWYVEHIGNLAATYGSIAAIAGLMLWLWLSALVILIGFELNHELEMRTQRWEIEERHRRDMEEWRRAATLGDAPPTAGKFVIPRLWRR